jgi:hypothetical protein
VICGDIHRACSAPDKIQNKLIKTAPVKQSILFIHIAPRKVGLRPRKNRQKGQSLVQNRRECNKYQIAGILVPSVIEEYRVRLVSF